MWVFYNEYDDDTNRHELKGSDSGCVTLQLTGEVSLPVADNFPKPNLDLTDLANWEACSEIPLLTDNTNNIDVSFKVRWGVNEVTLLFMIDDDNPHDKDRIKTFIGESGESGFSIANALNEGASAKFEKEGVTYIIFRKVVTNLNENDLLPIYIFYAEYDNDSDFHEIKPSASGCATVKLQLTPYEISPEEAAQIARLDAVKDSITNLPLVITLDSEDAISAARGLYDALVDEEKGMIPARYLDLLETAENDLAALKAIEVYKTQAAEVDKLLEAVITNVTKDNLEEAKAAYLAAYNAYEELSSEAKSYLTKSALVLDSAAAAISKAEEEDIPSEQPSEEPSEEPSSEPVSEPSEEPSSEVKSEETSEEPSEKPQPQPEKKGCKGGVAGTSMSLLAIFGLLISKKRRNSK